MSSANVACGGHAGDANTLHATLALARAHGVALGAHPGFVDHASFGRAPQPGVSAAEVQALVRAQVTLARHAAAAIGGVLHHVKAHGALANQAAAELGLALAIGRAIVDLDPSLRWIVMPGTALQRAAEQLGVAWIGEAYVDRGYGPQGLLVPRGSPGALLNDPAAAALRAVEMVARQALPLASGGWLPAQVDSLCVHGDSPQALAMVQALRSRLAEAGFGVAAPH